MDNIGDTWGFSGKTPVTLSRGFSVSTLTGVTLSWKTELNRSISTMEDGIPRWLQHCCGNHLSQRQIITQAVNLLSKISSGKFTRELDKESLLN